mmetsp:Transcript_18651/g.48382  ORF Transcript_18651/g.48382 Transcript_18651/m.48382 type:complete len:207 (-) Transcript_18651:4-624(-)
MNDVLFCFWPKMPPKKNDMPSTSKTLDKTDPRSVALTTSVLPARNVWTIMTISTAFPKVAFKRPASTSLCKPAASSSVASPRIFARGTSAKKFRPKTGTGPQSSQNAVNPSGKQTSIKFIGWFRMPHNPSPSVFGGFSIVVPFTNRDKCEPVEFCLCKAEDTRPHSAPGGPGEAELAVAPALMADRPRLSPCRAELRSCSRGVLSQ